MNRSSEITNKHIFADLNMTVEILGDIDEAKQFKEQENVLLNQTELESDHDNDGLEVEVRSYPLNSWWLFDFSN